MKQKTEWGNKYTSKGKPYWITSGGKAIWFANTNLQWINFSGLEVVAFGDKLVYILGDTSKPEPIKL